VFCHLYLFVSVNNVLQILNVSHPTIGCLLLTKFTEFLEYYTVSVDTSAVADVMEFLCIIDNSYLASGSCDERILIKISEELLWWRVLEQLLNHLTDISALPPVTASRLIVCLLNMLAVVIGSRDVLLIDHTCLDESHYLSVFEEQAAAVPADSENGGCRLASQLLEYCLIDMPLICVRRETSASFSSQTVCKIVETLHLIVHETDPVELTGILACGKCQKLVGVTWLHPLVMWSLRKQIFLHCYHELSSVTYDVCINDKIVSLCGELKTVGDDIDQSTAESIELQENPQHLFERALFIIRHRLEGYKG